jgi:hypothetical protein
MTVASLSDGLLSTTLADTLTPIIIEDIIKLKGKCYKKGK